MLADTELVYIYSQKLISVHITIQKKIKQQLQQDFYLWINTRFGLQNCLSIVLLLWMNTATKLCLMNRLTAYRNGNAPKFTDKTVFYTIYQLHHRLWKSVIHKLLDRFEKDTCKKIAYSSIIASLLMYIIVWKSTSFMSIMFELMLWRRVCLQRMATITQTEIITNKKSQDEDHIQFNIDTNSIRIISDK